MTNKGIAGVVGDGNGEKGLLGRGRALTRLAPVGALLAIVAGALFLRLWALSSQGFMFWDEGQYAMEAQFLTDTWRRLLGMHPDPSQAPWGRPPILIKPTHDLLLSLSMLAGGYTTLASQAVSAITGTLTVPLVFLLGRAVYSSAAGLLAAAFLAVLPLHVAYSRLAYSEANATFLFVLSAVLYWRARGGGRRTRVGAMVAGFVLGLGMTANYRLYIMLGAFLAWELAEWVVQRRQSRVTFVRWSILLLYSTLAPVLVWIGFYRWLGAYYQGAGLAIWDQVIPYEAQLKWFFTMMNGFDRPMFGDLDPLFYPYALWMLAGPGLIVVSALAVPLLWRDRSKLSENLFLAAWLLVPAIFFLFVSNKAPRCLAVALPGIALLAGQGLVLLVAATTEKWSPKGRGRFGGVLGVARDISSHPTLRKTAAAGLAMVVIVGGWSDSWVLANGRGGEEGATAYLMSQGPRKAVSDQWANVYFLSAGQLEVRRTPDTLEELRGLYLKGFRYIVIDDQSYLLPGSREVASSVERTVRPAFSAPDTIKQGLLFFLEHAEWLKVDLSRILTLRDDVRAMRGAPEVRVYELAEYFSTQ